MGWSVEQSRELSPLIPAEGCSPEVLRQSWRGPGPQPLQAQGLPHRGDSEGSVGHDIQIPVVQDGGSRGMGMVSYKTSKQAPARSLWPPCLRCRLSSLKAQQALVQLNDSKVGGVMPPSHGELACVRSRVGRSMPEAQDGKATVRTRSERKRRCMSEVYTDTEPRPQTW